MPSAFSKKLGVSHYQGESEDVELSYWTNVADSLELPLDADVRKYLPFIKALNELLDSRDNQLTIKILNAVREETFSVEETIPLTIPELAEFFKKDKRTVRAWLDDAGEEAQGKCGNAFLYTRAQVRTAMRHELDTEQSKSSKTRRSGRKNTLGTSVTRHSK